MLPVTNRARRSGGAPTCPTSTARPCRIALQAATAGRRRRSNCLVPNAAAELCPALFRRGLHSRASGPAGSREPGMLSRALNCRSCHNVGSEQATDQVLDL